MSKLNCIAFWRDFHQQEKNIIQEFHKDKKLALSIINKIREKNNIGLIAFDITYGQRNTVQLKERKDHYEIVLSPNWSMKNIPVINMLYDTHTYYKFYFKISIIKYQPINPDYIQGISIDFEDGEKMTCDNIKYNLDFYSDTNNNLFFDLFLFIDSKFLPRITKKNEKTFEDKNFKYKNNELNQTVRTVKVEFLIPKDDTINKFIYAALGEYNILHKLRRTEIYQDNAYEHIKKKPILELLAEVLLIRENIEKCKHCSRCNHFKYSNNLLKCTRCKKNYYCDKICQKADWKYHKHICKKI